MCQVHGKKQAKSSRITIDGNTYYGVFVKQWDPTSELYVITFTALSSEGVSVWSSKLVDKTDKELVP